MHYFKRLFSLLVILVVFLFTPLFSCLSESHYVIISEGTYLNGREKPSKKACITMRLFRGDVVDVIGFSGDWAEVYGGESGTSFIKAKYLSTILEPAKYQNISGGRVKVRKEPVSGSTAAWISTGKTVTVHAIVSGWGRISSGWIDLSYFERLD